MPEHGIHEGDDGIEDFQSEPPSISHEKRSVEPQAEKDVCNSCGLRKRKTKSSRPEEEIRCPSELGNGKEKSSRSGRDGRFKRRLLQPISLQVDYYLFLEVVAATFARDVISSVLALFLFLCSRSSSGELFMNQHEVSKDFHQKISEIRIVETPLHSVRSIAQNGKWVFKLARHDFLLLRTTGDKWYKAEKHGPSSGQAGIHIYPVTGPGAETIRFRSSISVDFRLAQAVAILKDHKLDYSLWGENCWKYAHSRAKAFLNSCIEIASDDNVRNELKKELENLMDAWRRMPNEVVDIVQDYNILRRVLFSCFTLVLCRFLLGFREISVNLPKYYKLGTVCSLNFALSFIHERNPILLTYNLTWLATAYRWPCHFLSFFGYYVSWTVSLPGVESFFLELEKHFEDPFLRTAVSGRGDLDITNSRANYHQDDSMEDQRKKWPPQTLAFAIHIVTFMVTFIVTFDQALGFSVTTSCCNAFGSMLVWTLITRGSHTFFEKGNFMKFENIAKEKRS